MPSNRMFPLESYATSRSNNYKDFLAAAMPFFKEPTERYHRTKRSLVIKLIRLAYITISLSCELESYLSRNKDSLIDKHRFDKIDSALSRLLFENHFITLFNGFLLRQEDHGWRYIIQLLSAKRIRKVTVLTLDSQDSPSEPYHYENIHHDLYLLFVALYNVIFQATQYYDLPIYLKHFGKEPSLNFTDGNGNHGKKIVTQLSASLLKEILDLSVKDGCVTEVTNEVGRLNSLFNYFLEPPFNSSRRLLHFFCEEDKYRRSLLPGAKATSGSTRTKKRKHANSTSRSGDDELKCGNDDMLFWQFDLGYGNTGRKANDDMEQATSESLGIAAIDSQAMREQAERSHRKTPPKIARTAFTDEALALRIAAEPSAETSAFSGFADISTLKSCFNSDPFGYGVNDPMFDDFDIHSGEEGCLVSLVGDENNTSLGEHLQTSREEDKSSSSPLVSALFPKLSVIYSDLIEHIISLNTKAGLLQSQLLPEYDLIDIDEINATNMSLLLDAHQAYLDEVKDRDISPLIDGCLEKIKNSLDDGKVLVELEEIIPFVSRILEALENDSSCVHDRSQFSELIEHSKSDLAVARKNMKLLNILNVYLDDKYENLSERGILVEDTVLSILERFAEDINETLYELEKVIEAADARLEEGAVAQPLSLSDQPLDQEGGHSLGVVLRPSKRFSTFGSNGDLAIGNSVMNTPYSQFMSSLDDSECKETVINKKTM